MNKEIQTHVHNRTHLNAGGGVFLPQWRMRRRRWEESVAHSQCNRRGIPAKLVPLNCTCGSINCLGDFYIDSPRQPVPVRPPRPKHRRIVGFENDGRFGLLQTAANHS